MMVFSSRKIHNSLSPMSAPSAEVKEISAEAVSKPASNTLQSRVSIKLPSAAQSQDNSEDLSVSLHFELLSLVGVKGGVFSVQWKVKESLETSKSRVMILGFKTSPQKQVPQKMSKWCPVPNNRIPKVQSQWRLGQLRKPFVPILESIPPERDQTHLLPYPLSHIFLLCCSSSSIVCPLLGKSRTPLTSLCQPLWCFMSFNSTLEAFKESCK